MKCLILAGALLALASAASAADLAPRVYTKAPVDPVFTWTGFYVGANVGAGWGTNTTDLNSLTIGGAVVPLTIPLGQVNQNGLLGGGQVGFNWQTGPLVLGIEAEGDWTDIRGHGPCLLVLTCSARQHWIADVAGRAGITFGRTLVFVKGGYAWSKLDTDTNLSLAGVTLSAPATATRTGYLVGTGIEHAIGQGWSAKVEYNYIDFGGTTQDVPVNITGVAVPITANVNSEQRNHLVKFGVNYRFGAYGMAQ